MKKDYTVWSYVHLKSEGTSRMCISSASEVTTLWRYTNLFIIIIIIIIIIISSRFLRCVTGCRG